MIHRYSVEIAGQEQEVGVEVLEAGRYRISTAAGSRIVDARRVAAAGRSATWSVLPDGGGRQALVDVDGALPDLTVTASGVNIALKVVEARRKVAARAAAPVKSGPLQIKSPMPGKVVKVLIKVGDEVKSGQGMLVVEAMKMENELRAPRDGRVQAVGVQEGQAVESGQNLATLE